MRLGDNFKYLKVKIFFGYSDIKLKNLFKGSLTMKFTNKKIKNVSMLFVLVFSFGCKFDYKKFEQKAHLINKYESAALKLAKENRELKAEIKRLEYKNEKLRQGQPKSAHSAHVESTPSDTSREIASIPEQKLNVAVDLVEFKTYKWKAEDLEKIANRELKNKNYEKAAQFYQSLKIHYPDHSALNDEFYFKAGLSAYEANYYEWVMENFNHLTSNYPNSPYYRSAKLWTALTFFKQGEKQKFFSTVEEFRKKYRNTKEWTILSSYYEKIEEKTHEK